MVSRFVLKYYTTLHNEGKNLLNLLYAKIPYFLCTDNFVIVGTTSRSFFLKGSLFLEYFVVDNH